MKVDVILGLQWGDEGKGKIVDVLTPNYQIVARFQGGPNAGHTLEFENQKYILKSIPSGIFQKEKINIIGNGMVVDPAMFKQEIETLEASGHKLTDRLYISKKAHLILPTHRLLDIASEKEKGDSMIGTTGRGIGPAYTDKIARSGLRIGDIFYNFEEKYRKATERHKQILSRYSFEYDLETLEKEWFAGIEKLKTFHIIDSEHFINKRLNKGDKVLAEGAQGSMLDVDFGTYPFVTSSNTVCAGACTGLGVSPHKIGEIFGVFKAYCTRVGSGPFPTELLDNTGKLLRDRGYEYGSVTKRPRRCGWIDLVALRYTIMLNDVTKLVMMKSDVLDTFDTIKACVAYEIDGKETKNLPFDISENIKPVYVELPGWKTDTTNIKSENEFPKEFNSYLAFLEKELGIPLTIVSVGPNRAQTIIRKQSK
ncbi:MAG: adenylosuccinate synthase [Dysgonamonadaceae bacterium]